ncbi:MAG: ABC transporter ATP-binding protein [Actinobacteria bacterium HGW-Actinobacteria-10]|jgi:ATPase subunit of ABC transporter with duplicated ATPase domains|nr:MAG: ABC transporter ATP-binding protein [Actinobacteria bacterium HGW-Actinobacteria-10]
MAYLLGCENVHLEYPTKAVFDSVTLGIDDGARVGIVGGNGDGKSTLLSLLAGSVDPDDGRVLRRGGTVTRTLEQTDALDPQATVALSVVGEVPEYTWASDARIRGIMGGLIADVAWNGCIGELSGGQRRRVDLARVLVQDSDVLMLDEPTNHLDVHAIAWLAKHLKERWPRKSGALLVVTHDRWFLDEVCTSMWEVHHGRVDQYEGGYSAYVFQRVQRAEAARTAEQKRKNILRKELAWLSRGAQARSTKPKFRVEAARALVDEEPPVRDSVELRRTAISRLGKQVVDLLDVTHRYADRTVIDDVTWHIGPGDRIGILGENGSGKTTLLNIIRGTLPPTAGQVKIGKTVKFAALTQHLDELDELRDLRVREVLARYRTRYEIDGKEITPAQLLERLGFEQAHLSAYVSDLSGGQKRRLQLMLILLDTPNVLILDEPDNDLDTDMLAVVESLLDTWPGTLLLITHDRHLMERVTDDQFALLDGKVRHVPGGVDEYLRILDTRAGERAAMPASACEPSAKSCTTESARQGLTRAEEYSFKKELSSAERKLNTLANRAVAIRSELHDADPSDYVALGDIQTRLHEVERQITDLEDEWIRLSELLS